MRLHVDWFRMTGALRPGRGAPWQRLARVHRAWRQCGAVRVPVRLHATARLRTPLPVSLRRRACSRQGVVTWRPRWPCRPRTLRSAVPCWPRRRLRIGACLLLSYCWCLVAVQRAVGTEPVAFRDLLIAQTIPSCEAFCKHQLEDMEHLVFICNHSQRCQQAALHSLQACRLFYSIRTDHLCSNQSCGKLLETRTCGSHGHRSHRGSLHRHSHLANKLHGMSVDGGPSAILCAC